MRWFAPLTVLVLAGCSSPEQADEEGPDPDVIPQVPSPAADGPQLIATRHRVVVRDRPHESGQVLGTLGLGAKVARGAEPYSKHGCSGGWYNIRPQGWVCNGDGVSVDLNAAAAAVSQPHLDKPMPYRYGRVISGAAVAYGALPNLEQQKQAEPKMGSHKASPIERLGLAANDVPLDEHFMPSGIAVIMPEGEGVADDGFRSSETWWMYPGAQTPPEPLGEGSALLDAAVASQTRVLKRRSGVAVTRTFMLGQGDAARRFALLPDGRFVPVDRLEPALGTRWHGIDAAKAVELPVAFALRRGVHAYQLGKNAKVERLDEEFEPKEIITLTGRFRTVNRQRYYFTRNDNWVRHKDIIIIQSRHRFPDWATPDQKWLDISLANQTLVAWEGHKLVYATLISSGSDRLGEPQTGPSTLQGVFRLRNKHVTRNVDDREVGQAYSIQEAPWVMEFHEGFSITGAYWHSRFGEARSYHDVAISPIDAHFLWHWSDPEVPDGWHSVAIAEDAADNTVVYIHK